MTDLLSCPGFEPSWSLLEMGWHLSLASFSLRKAEEAGRSEAHPLSLPLENLVSCLTLEEFVLVEAGEVYSRHYYCQWHGL